MPLSHHHSWLWDEVFFVLKPIKSSLEDRLRRSVLAPSLCLSLPPYVSPSLPPSLPLYVSLLMSLSLSLPMSLLKRENPDSVRFKFSQRFQFFNWYSSVQDYLSATAWTHSDIIQISSVLVLPKTMTDWQIQFNSNDLLFKPGFHIASQASQSQCKNPSSRNPSSRNPSSRNLAIALRYAGNTKICDGLHWCCAVSGSISQVSIVRYRVRAWDAIYLGDWTWLLSTGVLTNTLSA